MTSRTAEGLSPQAPPEEVARIAAALAALAAQDEGRAETIRRICENGELIAPSGFVFAICSSAHADIMGSRMEDGAWKAMRIPLGVDDRLYNGYEFVDAPDIPKRQSAITTVAIRTEAAGSETPDTVYAYNASGEARYDISDSAYAVELLPEPSPGQVYVRHEETANWRLWVFG